MKLETIKLSELNPAEYNPRTITAEEFEGLRESLKTFGQQENLIVNKDMTIISGHQRYEAMKSLGWTEAVCNMVDLDKHQEKKLNVIMNSTAISGKYDDLKLSEILEELKFDDDYEGLRLDKLEPLDLSDIEVEEDEAPEVSSEPPVSKLGEIYQLGRHRVMCGDSTDKANVELLMNGAKADMVFTDPPYGIGYKSNAWDSTKQSVKAKRTDEVIANDSNTDIGILGVEVSLNSVKADSHYYIWCRWDCYQDFKAVCQQLGTIKSVIVWDKGAAMGLGDLKGSYADSEWAIFGMIGRKELNNRENSVWQVNRMKGLQMQHPTQKPIELPARAIQNSSKSGDMVLDLFLGSGSTLIACEQTDRTCYGMELDPKYVDVIRKRYWKFTHDGNEEGWIDGTTN